MAAAPVEPKPADQPLGKLLASLSTGQVWGLVGACVAVIVGSFALGGVLQSGRDDALLNTKDRDIASLNSQIAANKLATDQQIGTLQTKVTDQVRDIAVVTANLTGALNEKDFYARKAEFLNRLVSYGQGRDEVSKKLLVDVVCLMWKETQKSRISMQQAPINITSEQLRTGIDTRTASLLMDNGMPSELIERIRNPERFVSPSAFGVSPFTASPFAVSRPPQVFPGQQAEIIRHDALDAAEKFTIGIRVVKIISFFDGSQYQMPDEIALAVHSKPECSPS